MSSWPRSGTALIAAGTLAWCASALAQGHYPGVGRAATPAEVAAWDTDVRPDFRGLPAGSGTVAQGMVIWEAQCASCHGIFGESNQTFSPLVGGTTADDVKTGRAARLLDAAYPGRTTLMKVSTLSTLWDYISRAMPWNAPKSLKPDEVYAVTAFMLNLGGIVPDDGVLSDRNMAEVQKRLPNRNGMTTNHGLWPGKTMGNGGKPDVRAVACMKDCAPEPQLASFLPDFARNAHGNLAEQNRDVGEQRGADTTRPAAATPEAARGAITTAVATQPKPVPSASAGAQALATKHLCLTCHAIENKVVGPSFRDVTKKYQGRADIVDYLTGKIRAGSGGLWGPIPMPPQPLSDADARTLAQWLAKGMPK